MVSFDVDIGSCKCWSLAYLTRPLLCAVQVRRQAPAPLSVQEVDPNSPDAAFGTTGVFTVEHPDSDSEDSDVEEVPGPTVNTAAGKFLCRSSPLSKVHVRCTVFAGRLHLCTLKSCT